MSGDRRGGQVQLVERSFFFLRNPEDKYLETPVDFH